MKDRWDTVENPGINFTKQCSSLVSPIIKSSVEDKLYEQLTNLTEICNMIFNEVDYFYE